MTTSTATLTCLITLALFGLSGITAVPSKRFALKGKLEAIPHATTIGNATTIAHPGRLHSRKLTQTLYAEGKVQIYFINECSYDVSAAVSYLLPVDRPLGTCDNGVTVADNFCNAAWYVISSGVPLEGWVGDTSEIYFYVYAYAYIDGEFAYWSGDDDGTTDETIEGDACNWDSETDPQACIRWIQVEMVGVSAGYDYTYTFCGDPVIENPSPSPRPSPRPSPVPSPRPSPIQSPISSPSPPPQGSGANGAAVAGAVIGGIAAAGLVAGSIAFFVMRRKRNGGGGAPPGPAKPPLNLQMSSVAVIDMPPTKPQDEFYLTNLPQGIDSTQQAPTHPAGLSLSSAASIQSSSTFRGYPGYVTAAAVPAAAGLSAGLSSGSAPPSAVDLSQDPLLKYIGTNLATRKSAASRGSLESWELRYEDIKMIRLIGQGSWGQVYRADWNGTQVAVKVMLDPALGGAPQAAIMEASGPVLQRLSQEAFLMSRLHHPNVLQLLGVTKAPAAIVNEFCSRGSLTDVLQAGLAAPEKAAELTWGRRMAFAADCARGMIYLHSLSTPIIHRDLKSTNLLVTGHFTVKVGDFGLSRELLADSQASNSSSMQVLNPRWLAPEILQGQPASTASDVFAFGVVMWELLAWQLPWSETSPWFIVGSISKGERLPIPSADQLPGGPDSGSWPQLPKYIALMERCWAHDTTARPSFREILALLSEIDPVATGGAV